MAELSKKIIYIISLSLIFSGCANQLPPGGGDVDKIPPQIIEVYPSDGATNYTEDYIEFGFSEYVDKRSFKDAVFISPAIDKNLEYDWSGKYVRVYFPEKLRENTTYVVTIGTDVVDFNNKNRMAEALSFAFSTGEKIDRRIISGKVFADKPEGIMIFAYDLTADTINPGKQKPDYISQTGTNGEFRVAGLAAATYRVFAVQDEFRDLIFQPDQDKIGVPFTDIILKEADTLFSNLYFFLSEKDTVAPRLLSASMTDRMHILLNFTEEFDSAIINSTNFYLFDSTANKKIELLYAFKGNTKATEMAIVTRDSLLLEHSYYLFSDTIKDKKQNIFTGDFTSVTLSEKPDTTKPSLFKTLPKSGATEIDYEAAVIKFYFNDAFDTNAVKNVFTFSDTLGKTVPFSLRFIDDGSFEIRSVKNLDPQKDYLIKFPLKNFKDAAGNFADSLYIFKFRTISGLDFTGISGQIFNINLENNPYLVLQSVDRDKTYVHKLNNTRYDVVRVEPGKYILWAFLDRDSSGTFTPGNYFPYKPSEEFSYYTDTLTLRPRWVQTELKFVFK